MLPVNNDKNSEKKKENLKKSKRNFEKFNY